MTMNKQILGVTIRTWWTLVIACAVSSLGTWAAIDHSNAQTERKFRQAIRISDDKHRQALHAQAVLFAYSINKTACGFRRLGDQAIKRAQAALDDPRSSDRVKGSARLTIKQTRAFLDTTITTAPADFDCKTLTKHPPKAAP